MVVFFKAMIKRIRPYHKSKRYHSILKANVLNNINTK